MAAYAFNHSSCDALTFSPRETTPSDRTPECAVLPRAPKNESEWDLLNSLAARYAPIFNYHIEESSYPQSVLSFMDHSELHEHPTGPFYALKSWVYRHGSMDFSDARIYADYQVRDKIATIKYFVFYPYTDKQFSSLTIKMDNKTEVKFDRLMELAPFGVHEGDFEAIDAHVNMETRELLGLTTWEFVPNGLPRRPVYTPSTQLNVTDTHPNLFVSLGTHNTYVKPGDHRLYTSHSKCFSASKTPFEVSAELFDRAAGNGRQWNSGPSLRAIRDPRRATPSWVTFKGHFGNMQSPATVAVGCREGGRFKLAQRLATSMTKTYPNVTAAVINTFTEGYMNFMCDSLSPTMFPWLEDPVGVLAPTTPSALEAANVAQMRQCESLDSYIAERERAFSLMRELHNISEYHSAQVEASRVAISERQSAVLGAEKNYTDAVLAARAAAKKLDHRRDAVVSQYTSLSTAREIKADLTAAAKSEKERQIVQQFSEDVAEQEQRAEGLSAAVRAAKKTFHDAVERVKSAHATLEAANRALALARIELAQRRAAADEVSAKYAAAEKAYHAALDKESKLRESALKEAMADAKLIKDENERKLAIQRAAAELEAANKRAAQEQAIAEKFAAEKKAQQDKLAQEEANARAAAESAAAAKKAAEDKANKEKAEHTAALEAKRAEAERLGKIEAHQARLREKVEAAAAEAKRIADAEGKHALAAIEAAIKAEEERLRLERALKNAEKAIADATDARAREAAEKAAEKARADEARAAALEKRLLEEKRRAQAEADAAKSKSDAENKAAEEARKKAEEDAAAKKKAEEEAEKERLAQEAAEKAAEEAKKKAQEEEEKRRHDVDHIAEEIRKAEERLKAEEEAARKKAEEDAKREKELLDQEAEKERQREKDRLAAEEKAAAEKAAAEQARKDALKAEEERQKAEEAARKKAEAEAEAAAKEKAAREEAERKAREEAERNMSELEKLLERLRRAEEELAKRIEEERLVKEAAAKAKQAAETATERVKSAQDNKVRAELEKAVPESDKAAKEAARRVLEAEEATKKARELVEELKRQIAALRKALEDAKRLEEEEARRKAAAEAEARRKAAAEAAAAEKKRREQEAEEARKRAENEKSNQLKGAARYAGLRGRTRDPVAPRWVELDATAQAAV